MAGWHDPRPAINTMNIAATRFLIVALVSACLYGLGTSAARGAQPVTPAAAQPLAELLSNHRVHVLPRAGSAAVGLLPARRPITAEITTVPVVGRSRQANGVRWLRVMLPGRPNSSTGWIAQQGTRARVTGWSILVNLARRRVEVYRHGKLTRSFGAVVGKPSTPTPTGRFFVEETFRMVASEPGGPIALALSARSEALQEFEGGPGQIALHGRDGLGGTLGAAESHGCVRLDTAGIEWLGAHIFAGTPVRIARG
jgi:lipoprotein-anchoring transpeptidase ErfK/SrfK